MKKFHLDLQRFTGITVTCQNTGNFTAFSASPNSSVAKDATVTLTVTPASGYELDTIEVISGGVTIVYGDAITFTAGETDVVLTAKAKKNNLYKITENAYVSVNGSVTRLQRNMIVKRGPSGAVVGVDCTPTEVTLDAGLIAELVEAGVLIKV